MSALRSITLAALLAGALGACAQSGPSSPRAQAGPMVTYEREITVNLKPQKPVRIEVEPKAATAAAPAPARRVAETPAPAPAPAVKRMVRTTPSVTVPSALKQQAVNQARAAAPRIEKPKRKATVYKKEGLEGAPAARVRLKLGPPDHIQREGDAMLWTYRVDACTVHLLIDGDRVKTVTVRKSLIHTVAAKAEKPCFHRFVTDRLNRNREAASLR